MDIDNIDFDFSGSLGDVSWAGTVDVTFGSGDKMRFQFEDDTSMTPILAQLQEAIKARVRERLKGWITD